MRSELEQTIGGHPCPVGGRTVFREYDSYEICPFCGWEDNAFQEAHPYTGGGPNASLHSCRRSYRKKIAVNPSYTWAKEQDELCLKKGIFWIVDRENLKKQRAVSVPHSRRSHRHTPSACADPAAQFQKRR